MPRRKACVKKKVPQSKPRSSQTNTRKDSPRDAADQATRLSLSKQIKQLQQQQLAASYSTASFNQLGQISPSSSSAHFNQSITANTYRNPEVYGYLDSSGGGRASIIHHSAQNGSLLGDSRRSSFYDNLSAINSNQLNQHLNYVDNNQFQNNNNNNHNNRKPSFLVPGSNLQDDDLQELLDLPKSPKCTVTSPQGAYFMGVHYLSPAEILERRMMGTYQAASRINSPPVNLAPSSSHFQFPPLVEERAVSKSEHQIPKQQQQQQQHNNYSPYYVKSIPNSRHQSAEQQTQNIDRDPNADNRSLESEWIHPHPQDAVQNHKMRRIIANKMYNQNDEKSSVSDNSIILTESKKVSQADSGITQNSSSHVAAASNNNTTNLRTGVNTNQSNLVKTAAQKIIKNQNQNQETPKFVLTEYDENNDIIKNTELISSSRLSEQGEEDVFHRFWWFGDFLLKKRKKKCTKS